MAAKALLPRGKGWDEGDSGSIDPEMKLFVVRVARKSLWDATLLPGYGKVLTLEKKFCSPPKGWIDSTSLADVAPEN